MSAVSSTNGVGNQATSAGERSVWLQRPGGALRLLVPVSAADTVRFALDALPADLSDADLGTPLLDVLREQLPAAALRAVAEQVGRLDALMPAPVVPGALARAALAGETKVALTFGGQAQAYIDSLAALLDTPEGGPIVRAAAAALADELAGEARLCGLHPAGLDVLTWLRDPASRPEPAALAAGPVSQPLVFVTQMARLATLRRVGLDPQHIGRWAVATTGHSQGLLAALVAAEGHGPAALAQRSAQCARYLLWQGIHMQSAWGAPAGAAADATMLAITGWPEARVRPLLTGVSAVVALHNGPDRLVLSGDPQSLATVAQRIAAVVAKAEAAAGKGQGPRENPPVVEPLTVSAPYHAPPMAPAVAPSQAAMARLGLRFDPARLQVPVLRYEDGQPWDGTPDLPTSFCLHPVRWDVTMSALAERGVRQVVDAGPGAGVATLVGLNLLGHGAGVIAADTAAGQARLASTDPVPELTPWARFAPVGQVQADGSIILENQWTRVTGRPPVLLPGMTPTTADAPIVVAAANAGFVAELAGGGQTTEAILRRRAAELRAALAPGEGYVFNALYLDPYLWGLQLGEHRLVPRLRAEGHPIEGVTVSAGLPPVAEAVRLLAEWRGLGMHLNAFKAGNDAQIAQVLEIADADAEAAPNSGPFTLQIECGRAGGHHGFDDLDTLLLRHYGRIRRRRNLLLAVGGGIADGARVNALLSGTWSLAHGRPPMPVDAVFVGTLAMACAEAATSPAVKAALVQAPGADKILVRGAVDGGVRSGRSGLGADIHYLDNRAARVAALLDSVAGDAAAVAARKTEIAAALAGTAKPWLGEIEHFTCLDFLKRFAQLMAIGRHGSYEDGVWLDADHRARFGDTLRRLLRRCAFEGTPPANAELNDPAATLSALAAACPALALVTVQPEDARWFVAHICGRPGKPVPFVPVIDANVHRWFTRDSLWQAHDDRFEAEAVLVLPGAAAVAGVARADEPVADLFDRLLAETRVAAPKVAAPARPAPVDQALAEVALCAAGALRPNPLLAAVAAGARLRAGEPEGLTTPLRLSCRHVRPEGGEVLLNLDYALESGRRAPLRATADQAATVRAFYRHLLTADDAVRFDADRLAAYARSVGDDARPEAPVCAQVAFAAALPALLRAALDEAVGADPLSLLHHESQVRLLRPLRAGATTTRLAARAVTDTPAGRSVRVQAIVSQGDFEVAHLDQTFIVRRAEGPAPATTAALRADDFAAVPAGVALERPRVVLDAAVFAPRDLAAFAHASGDLNPIHRDPVFAALAGLSGPIVHGQWTAAMACARLTAEGEPLRAVTARFVAPVLPGERLNVRAEVVARHQGDEIIALTVRNAAGPVLHLRAWRQAPLTAVVFPGQGCQRKGMGKAARARSEAARSVWQAAEDHCRAAHGFSLLQVVDENPRHLHLPGTTEETIRHPEGVLNVTQFTQVALTVLAVAGVAELREAGVLPEGDAELPFFGGHSVGEYSALSAMTDLLPLPALIDVVYARGRTMQHFVPRDAEGRSCYGMAVVRPDKAGIDEAAAFALVTEAAQASDAPLYVVNHNIRHKQYAVAGHLKALAALKALLPEAAWVDLAGIDVPFHSPLLSEGVPAFRETLRQCLPAGLDVRPLVGRYLPNLVARPFALTAEFVSAVEAVTGVALPAMAADPEAHGRDLLIELLAWQFASPVRWIETQDVLARSARRVIEIGPEAAPVLVRMLQSTLGARTDGPRLWHAETDHDAVLGLGPVLVVDEAPEVPANTPAVAAAAAPMAAAGPADTAEISDQPLAVGAALRALVAVALGQPLAVADGEKPLDALLGGNSARRNQVLVDLGQEFGVGAMDNAHELPLGQLAAAIEAATGGRYRHPGPYLKAAQAAALGALGLTHRAAESTLTEKFGLPAGRRAAVLTVLTAEKCDLNQAVATYGSRVGQTFAPRVAAASGAAAQATGEAAAVSEARFRTLARAALAAGGLDPLLVDRALATPVAAPRPAAAPSAVRFEPNRHVALTGAECWARGDALRLFAQARRGQTVDLSGVVRAASPALVTLLRDLAHQVPEGGVRGLFLQAAEQAQAHLALAPRYAGDTAVITGAGPDSIAEAAVARLLEGGARVVVTTSRPRRDRQDRYKALYRAHAARGAELHLVPLDQGNLADIDAFCAWLYRAHHATRGAARVEVKAPWRPTLCLPFGAVPAEGDPTTYDTAIVDSLRVNLVGVGRLVGALAREAIEHHAPRVHVVLPLSPNHGQMGRDGLYAEAKAGLEALLPRWQSEHDRWGKAVGLVGARIGWVRGTGLMAGLDKVHAHLEATLGITTYSTEEMAAALLDHCTPALRLRAASAPVVADLSGGFGAVKGLREAVEGALALARQAARPAAHDTSAAPLPRQRFGFPALPASHRAAQATDSLGQSALDLHNLVAVVGYGEVGPFGSARVRWAAECAPVASAVLRAVPGAVGGAALAREAALELAWLCGCVRFERGQWVDAADGSPVDTADLEGRYGLAARVGIRNLTAFDPQAEVLFDEVVLTADLRFAVAEAAVAQSFVALDPAHTVVLPDGDGFTVVRRAGSRVRVPRQQPLDRDVAGQLPDGFDATRLGIDAAETEAVDPVAIHNLLATAAAFRSMGMDPEALRAAVHPARIGCSQGSGIGGMRALRRLYTESRLSSRRQTDVLQETLINVTAAWPAMRFYGGFGAMVNPVAACATAAVSVEVGCDLLHTGKADFVVAGAFDDIGAEGARGFADMQATIDAGTRAERNLDPDQASRPCDARRGGFVEAQGGGTLLLCSVARALELGLPIYGVVAGAWTRGDGLQRSVPAPGPGLLSVAAGGMNSHLGRALRSVGLGADDVGLVSIHGTSTEANDRNEIALHADIAAALGRREGNPLPVVAQKALTGHAKGGAAAWQIIGALQALADQVVPPMRNLETPDPSLAHRTPLVFSDQPIAFAPGALKAALVTSLGFGHVGALVCLAHPDTVLGRLPAAALAEYAARRAPREAACVAAEHAVLMGEVPYFVGRDPDDHLDVQALLLDPRAGQPDGKLHGQLRGQLRGQVGTGEAATC